MTRRGFAVEFTSLARARMAPGERDEVYAWARENEARVYVWYRDRQGGYEAVLSQRDRIVARQSSESPIAAFRKAAAAWDPPAIVSLLTPENVA